MPHNSHNQVCWQNPKKAFLQELAGIWILRPRKEQAYSGDEKENIDSEISLRLNQIKKSIGKDMRRMEKHNENDGDSHQRRTMF